MAENYNDSSSLVVATSALGGSLMQMLMSDDIRPGSDPGYELCKIIYLYHPLGSKMAETPLNIAQSQKRERVVQDAPNEVMEAFEAKWDEMKCTPLIHNVMRISRIYGIGSVIMLVEGEDAAQPLDLTTLWSKKPYFNVLDPLNTSGSLVLSQIPTNRYFNKPVTVSTMGQMIHPSRFEVAMNEEPVFIAYTASAFGFVGRSVYQRALFPLKSFIRSMIADDMIATKLGLLVAKQKQPGSIINQAMSAIAGLKRGLLKQAQTGQVLSIDVEEEITTLNMQNVDGAGKYSRDNIIKNVATSADMPAKLLDQETMVSGFGEGSEDAKNIAKYIDKVRGDMELIYKFFEKITMRMAWTPEFYKTIQNQYPENFKSRSFESAFSEWESNYSAEWPSLLIEPESEQIKVEQTKLEAIVSFLQTLLPQLDPENQGRIMQWATDNVSENKLLFPHELDLDYDTLTEFQELAAQNKQDQQDASMAGAGGTDSDVGPEAKKFGKFG